MLLPLLHRDFSFLWDYLHIVVVVAMATGKGGEREMENRSRRSMTIHRHRGRSPESRRYKGNFDPIVTVTLIQIIFCLLLVVGVFTMQFLDRQQYEWMGDYYKAAMGEEMGEAVFVGNFGEPLDWDKIQQYLDYLSKGFSTENHVDEARQKKILALEKPIHDNGNNVLGNKEEEFHLYNIEDFLEEREGKGGDHDKRFSPINRKVSSMEGGQGGGCPYIPTNIYYGPVLFTAAAHPPAYGVITSRFGLRNHPITNDGDFHTGIDVAAPLGESVYAIYSGQVEEVGVSNIYGNYIRVRHSPRLTSLYGHCSRILPEEGTMVRAGERIGEVGSTGLSTGPHVHLSLLVDGRYVDPMALYSL